MAFLAKRLVTQLCQSHLWSPLRNLALTSMLRQTNEDTNLARHAQMEHKSSEIFKRIDEQVAAAEEGRLFAVVHLCGKQFKVTSGDIILVEGYWPPDIGDEIRLEKVLLAGGRDFTLVGQPFLFRGLVNVTATIIEKTLTHTKTHFRKRRRKQYMRIKFQRSPNTMIRINTIGIERKLQELESGQPVADKKDFDKFY